MKAKYQKFGELIEKSEKILIISHKNPDADTLGAAIALRIWLGSMSRDVTLACIDRPSASFGFLPFVDEFVSEFDLASFDLLIVVDAGASYMTGFEKKYSNLFSSGIPVVNIDHHGSNDDYGTLNIVDPEASSATIILFRIFKNLGVEINEWMAGCLLAGIYGDTGSFMHSNTDQEVYEVAAELMKRGGKISNIIKSLFKNNDVDTLKLWGLVMQKAKITDNGVVISAITKEDYEALGVEPSHLSGVIDFLNMVPGTKFAMLIHEDRKGNVKGSLRTRNDDVNLSQIAAEFGGGGHPKASGFTLPGKIKKTERYEIIGQDPDGREVKKSLDF